MREIRMTVLVALALMMGAAGADQSAVGRMTMIVGTVTLQKADGSAQRRARPNMAVQPGDTVVCAPESRCEISYTCGVVMRSNENSTCIISPSPAVATSPDTVHHLRVIAGAVWVNARKLARRTRFDVHTPTATAGIRGTTYNADCNDNAADILVFEGAVAVSARDSAASDTAFTVTSGQRIAVVRDVEAFIVRQQKAWEEYQEAEQDAYERFLQQENEAYASYRQRQARERAAWEKAFEPLGRLQVARRSFDADSLAAGEWISWNRQQDSR